MFLRLWRIWRQARRSSWKDAVLIEFADWSWRATTGSEFQEYRDSLVREGRKSFYNWQSYNPADSMLAEKMEQEIGRRIAYAFDEGGRRALKNAGLPKA